MSSVSHGGQKHEIALVSLLKACAKHKDLFKGRSIHEDIRRQGLLGKNVFIGNSLVNMYAKCGALAHAQEVFDELPLPNVVSWTTLIAGYCQHGHGQQALETFCQMQQEGLSANAVTFSCVLKACGSLQEAEKGIELHTEIARKGLLASNVVLGSALVDMYAKCGALSKAQEVFDGLPFKNEVSWNALITGYCQHERGDEALDCFEAMKCDGLSPDAVTYACILKACGSIEAAEKGQGIHDEIVANRYLETDTVLGNALVDMYAKCGVLEKAQQVFDGLSSRDEVSWNALIAGYSQHGGGDKALISFEQMKREGLTPSSVTYACVLIACGSTEAIHKGKKVHAEIVRLALLESSTVLGNALVDMYSKCGSLAKAQHVFDELPDRDVVTWSTLIAEYCQHGHGKEALNCFEQMKHEGLSPDAATFAFILKACGSIKEAEKGEEVHAEIVTKGLLGNGTVVGNALVDMYTKCGALSKAQEVFNELPVRDVVSWNTLVTGYAQHGDSEAALNYFEKMRSEGLCPDAVTFPCILKACGSMRAAEKGKEVHDEIIRKGLLGNDIVLGNALVDMYAKCGELDKAQEVFDELHARDMISWNALIAGFSEHEQGEEALNYYEEMKREGLFPDAGTLACILKACGSIGAVDKGEDVHAEVVRKKLLGNNTEIGCALVDMYAKCGALVNAQRVFEELPEKNVVSWTGLIGGYCEFGHGQEALSLFERMEGEGITPDAVTFALILKACSGLGAVDKGQIYFETMRTRYSISPNLEHYSCMVDLFGRVGQFDKAMSVIKQMPSCDHLPLWSSLLSACFKWGNVNIGKAAFENAVRLDKKYAVAYNFMSRIYAAAGMHDEAKKIEVLRLQNMEVDEEELLGGCL